MMQACNIGFPNTVSATTMSASSFTGGSITVTGTSRVAGAGNNF